MIHAHWEPDGRGISARERLREAERIRQKCQQERHLMGEEGYAAYMNHAARLEELARVDTPSGHWAQELRDHLDLEARKLAATKPHHWKVISLKLRDHGYDDWQADKLIIYASFIQARGWDAFYPEDAAFLQKKYEDAGVDAEQIDFDLG